VNREEAMNAVAAARSGAAVIVGPGANGGLLYERADAPATIYNMDMGYATAIALGIALARPRRRVLAIEGDGSFYAGSTVLSTIWRVQPANLVVVVLDNRVWGTGDGLEPTATAFGLDLANLALAAGWKLELVHSVDEAAELERRLKSALASDGPHFILGRTDPKLDPHLGSQSARPRPRRHLLDCAVLMRAELARDG
jgi:thiamine pyrophosphate-dependent acetolactate synthase large subunit-like protein